MSKIKELLNDKESVLVFDVDGVLALLEFGEYHHYILSDEEWDKANIDGINYYTDEKVSKKMQAFLKEKNKDRVYVVTKANSLEEFENKKIFLNKNYEILMDNMFYVKKDTDKKDKMKLIKEKYKDLPDYKMVMVDDSITVLSDVMYNTSFSTAHISSFLDI